MTCGIGCCELLSTQSLSDIGGYCSNGFELSNVLLVHLLSGEICCLCFFILIHIIPVTFRPCFFLCSKWWPCYSILAMRMERCWPSRIPMHPSVDCTSLTWTAGGAGGCGGITWFHYVNCLFLSSFWSQSSYEVLKLCSFEKLKNQHSQEQWQYVGEKLLWWSTLAFNLPLKWPLLRQPGFRSRRSEWQCELVGTWG